MKMIKVTETHYVNSELIHHVVFTEDYNKAYALVLMYPNAARFDHNPTLTRYTLEGKLLDQFRKDMGI